MPGAMSCFWKDSNSRRRRGRQVRSDAAQDQGIRIVSVDHGASAPLTPMISSSPEMSSGPENDDLRSGRSPA
jgi:hypothetical protein